MIAEEALIVGIQNGHERSLRYVQSLPEQVDADEHIILSCAELIDYLHAVKRVHIRMDIVGLHPHIIEEAGNLLSLTLRGRDDQ